MTWGHIAFEAVKLALQFGGAIFIAYRAVQWALRRYQQEKHWERRLSAYTDLVSALSAVISILSHWESQELSVPSYNGETSEETRNRYWAARRTLVEARGAANLLLPSSILAELDDFYLNLARHDATPRTDFIDQINGEWALMEKALKSLTDFARKDLNFDARKTPPVGTL